VGPVLDVERLRARLPARAWTRFAPAPTGFLHLGHVANAVTVWAVARAVDTEVLLRVEDHDRQRSRPEYERALLDDLDWLGFAPDRFPTNAFRAGPCEGRQSDREAVYREAADALAARGLLYACSCSRREIEDGASPGESAPAELRYPGTCRERGLDLGGDVGWRLRLPPGEERFEDAWRGPQRQTPARQCGDVLVRDRRRNWTYQFAVAVDDLHQDVALVVRGLDLLESTGRQIQIARLLGRAQPPVFLHHPLLLKPEGRKLSKADGDTGVRELRAAGWSAERVIGEAAWRLRLLPSPRPVPASEVAALFSGGSPAR
jgi:glutamyl/glutaminyl-tRNA synthetase